VRAEFSKDVYLCGVILYRLPSSIPIVTGAGVIIDNRPGMHYLVFLFSI